MTPVRKIEPALCPTRWTSVGPRRAVARYSRSRATTSEPPGSSSSGSSRQSSGSGSAGPGGVLLHLVPHPAQGALGGLLDHPVDLLEQVERKPPAGILRSDEVGELVLQGLGDAGLPGEGDRVDLVAEPPVELALGDVEAGLLAVEAAVGVEHDPARGGAPRPRAFRQVVEDAVDLALVLVNLPFWDSRPLLPRFTTCLASRWRSGPGPRRGPPCGLASAAWCGRRCDTTEGTPGRATQAS